jgi:hypothetical protein
LPALAVLRAEGIANPVPFQSDNTAAFVHRLPVVSRIAGAAYGQDEFGARAPATAS